MKILAAIDQSEYAGKVLDKALRLAAWEKGEVTALTINTAPYNNLYMGVLPAELMDKYRDAVMKTVEMAKARMADASIPVKVVIEDAPSAAGAIVGFAEKNGFDLIVVGHKGMNAIERFLIGSVSSQVAAHAPCSVFVVHE